jgi:ubiquinone/menaquinone biosynthesis C-methylase UbiE
MELKFKELNEHQIYNSYLTEYNSNNKIKKFLFKNFYKAIRDILSQILSPSDSIFEVGCGPGESSDRISKMLFDTNHFIVSDYDPRHVTMIRKMRPHLNVKQANVLQLEETDNAYDIVVILEVLEHIDQYEQALDEIFRVAKKWVIISVPREPLWRILNMLRLKYILKFGNTPDHSNHWSTSSLKKMLSKYGQVRKVYQPIPWSVVLVEKK